MATNESWVLDGVALTSGNFNMLELNADPPTATRSWLTAADSENAALLRQPFHENRVITMTLRVAAQASFNAALDQVGVIADKLRLASATADGIALVWTPANSTRAATFDVVAGQIEELPITLEGQGYSWFNQRPVFKVEMTAKPYYRYAEATTSTANTSTPFVTLAIPSVPGDVPATGRLIVTDAATQTRRHLEWGLENQYYNASTSLLVDSDDMVVTGFSGAQTTRTGSYDPNASGNNVVRASLVPSQATAICGTGNLLHVGMFRVKARIFCSSVDVRVGLTYRYGNGPMINATGGYVGPIAPGAWCEIDLGLITIPPKTQGTQRWTGIVAGYATNSTAGVLNVDIDYLILVPALEGYGKARSANPYTPGPLLYYDDFTSTVAGTVINLRTPMVGSTAWASAGSATDFTTVDGPTTGEETLARSTVSDAAPRFALLSNTIIEQEIIAYVYWSVPATGIYTGLIGRYVDTSNYLYYRISKTTGPAGVLLQPELGVVVAGVATTLTYAQLGALAPQWLKMRLTVRADGATLGTLFTLSGATLSYQSGSHASLATAGALATGRGGIYDYNSTAGAQTRYYDTVSVSTPAVDERVINPGRTMEVHSDETVMTDAAGTYYGPVPYYRGARFMVPTGTSRVLVKARRADVDVNADDAPVTDSTTIQVAYTPRGLVVPR